MQLISPMWTALVMTEGFANPIAQPNHALLFAETLEQNQTALQTELMEVRHENSVLQEELVRLNDIMTALSVQCQGEGPPAVGNCPYMLKTLYQNLDFLPKNEIPLLVTHAQSRPVSKAQNCYAESLCTV